MQKIPKFLSIDSFSPEDINDLFNAICMEVLNSTPANIKQKALKLNGSKKELDAYKPSLAGLMTLITTYDIKFDFKITYLKTDMDAPDLKEEEVFVDPLKKEIDEQSKVIVKDPEPEKTEFGGKKVEVVEVDNSGKPIKEADIPDFE